MAERGDAGVAACCACSSSLFISPAVKVTARRVRGVSTHCTASTLVYVVAGVPVNLAAWPIGYMSSFSPHCRMVCDSTLANRFTASYREAKKLVGELTHTTHHRWRESVAASGQLGT